MEEAQGITLHALDKRRNTTYSLLGERLKGEQVRVLGCFVRTVGYREQSAAHAAPCAPS